MSKQPLDLDAIRERLARATGRQYWRSLDELADSEEFHSFLDREFPRQAQAFDGVMDRRTFMKLMGASLALAGLSGCQFAWRPPRQKIVPYVRMPEEMIPGKPLFFATALTQGGFGLGVIAETFEGRPTKLEGNPDHPASLGASNIFLQASILQMYDPDRSQAVLNKAQPSTWEAFKQAVGPVMAARTSAQGAGLRILTETVTSPTTVDLLTRLLQALPQARWVQYEPAGLEQVRAGATAAFGQSVNPVYSFTNADVVLALDADFLVEGPGHIRYARDFINRRRAQKDMSAMNRLYAVEPTPSLTGVMADHRLQVRPAIVESLARTIAQTVGVSVAAGGPALSEAEQKFAAAVAKDLQQKKGRGLVIAGLHQPPPVHALAHAINQALGNVGQTVSFTEPVEVNQLGGAEELRKLVQEMDAGQVDTLIVIGGNPVYYAPADVNFAGALAKVPNSIHLSLYVDETSQAVVWHVNEAHELESWGDTRAYDGTASIIQPMIQPLYDGKTAAELVALLSGQEGGAYELVRAYWQTRLGGEFENAWASAVQKGVVPNTAAAPATVTLKGDFDVASPAPAGQGLDIVFRPDGTLGDGRWANNGWLQELPKPMTKLTWDNAVLISPATAREQGVTSSDVVTITYGGASVNGPIWILPGQADGVITVQLGHGRTAGGKIASSTTGFNAYRIRTAATPWFGSGAQIAKTGERALMVSTQDHNSMEGRDLVLTGTLEEYQQNPDFLHELIGEHEDITIYPRKNWEGIQWGMAIDLNACIGCGTCTVACNAENNIAVVGKDQVWRGREMHWIRIDRYFEGANPDDPQVVHQPMFCQHCENAPCESVCPVGATVHTADGLNGMTYNRCVGTRYCSNNCPYKVRRFNFFQYTLQPRELVPDPENTPVPDTLKMVRNPNVTVRSRGVMEKCTYCVQRIASARQDAERQGVPLKDGDVVTACEQACPTQAIVFGNINDLNSRVAKVKAEKLNYTLLDHYLNTKPRTSYLGRLRNPNPELGEA